ncbi:VOC family protein [Candidatus Saganbacteria bacterium]|nr:VOC family protein [Candidatus Saganbacteria bacterium]
MLKIKKFRHAAIVVNDLETMLEFYVETLGFVLKRKFEIESDDFRKGVGMPDAKAKVAHLSLPDSDIEIEIFEYKDKLQASEKINRPNYPGYRHIAFIVKDLDESYRELKEKGLRFYSEPITIKEPEMIAGFRFVYFNDPEGNIIELNQLPDGKG